jgi:acetyl esterase/lipase
MIDRRKFITHSVASLLTGPAFISAATITASAAEKNISYGANRLDIYPPGSSNAPVLVYVHGGAWRAGSKNRVGSMPSYFNAGGHVFVSVGYTLHPRADVDRQAREIGQAIGWIRANIAKFGGDPARIALMGHSAGCHLASLATLSGLAPGVRVLIANDTAAYDVAYLASINNNRLPVLYSAPFSDRSKWTNWSPINYAGGSGRLPVLVAWSGGRDRDRISQRFAARLESSGHRVTRFDGRRYNHISIRNAVGKRGDALTDAIDNFLSRNL